MSALQALDQDLKYYQNLPHHSNPELTDKLKEVQLWQRNRLNDTHQTLFSQSQNKLMADYFVNRLYGGSELNTLIGQLERIVPKAKKVEKLTSFTATKTGAAAIRSAIVATKLDLTLAEYLLKHDLPVNRDNMLKTYQDINDADARREQMQNLKQVCYATDKHINSFMLKKAFKLAKGSAYKYGLNALYDFIDDGFKAMKPLKKMNDFIDPVCEKEIQIINQVHAWQPGDSADPFKL